MVGPEVLDNEVKLLHPDCFADMDSDECYPCFAYMEVFKCNLELIDHTFVTVAVAWGFMGITSLEVLQ